MDAKKDQIKHELANCFKRLVVTVPFEKITIKMIADTIKKWGLTDDTHSCEELCEAYHYLLRHSLLDLLNRDEKEH
ncbi:MAG: hypothetical protein E7256_04625 [Lachnospiraceae bacterium]|nr:hypothetical protein [Lachnospiraceae bacterium]